MSKKIKFIFFLLAFSCMAYLGLSYLKGVNLLNSANTYYIYLRQNIGGIHDRDSIFFNGMHVGNVKSIIMDYKNDNVIKITLSIDKDLKLYKNTIACLHCGGIIAGIGNNFIELEYEKTNTFELLPNFSQLNTRVDVGASNTITATLKSLEEMLNVTNTFLIEISKNTVKISNIFENLDHVTKQLGIMVSNNEKNILDIGKQTSLLLALINNSENGAPFLLKTLNNFLLDTSSSIKKNLLNVSSIISTINEMLDKANKGENSIGMFINNDDFYNNANNAIISANDLLLNIKKHPSRYVNFSIFHKNKES